MAKWTKRILGAGVIAGAAYALWKVIDQRTRESTLEWTPQPLLSPPMPVPHVPEHGAAPKAPSNGSSTGSTNGSGAAPAAADAPPPPPEAATADAPWVDPVGGACPVSHPVKAKLGSGIFHVPGGQMYDRTVPDRCYVDAAAAEADGLRASKR